MIDSHPIRCTQEVDACTTVRSRMVTLHPPLVPDLEGVDEAQARLDTAEACLAQATEQSEVKLQTALAEQARRNLRKVQDWRSGAVKISVYIWQLGQIFLVAVPGEPYSWLQTEIRRRCAAKNIHILVLATTNGSLSQGYLLPTPAPAPNSYQHRIAVVGEGGLDMIVDTAVAQINEWVYR